MAHHQVTKREFWDWLELGHELEYARSVGKGSNKALHFVVRMTSRGLVFQYRVVIHGNTENYDFVDDALDAYNAAL